MKTYIDRTEFFVRVWADARRAFAMIARGVKSYNTEHIADCMVRGIGKISASGQEAVIENGCMGMVYKYLSLACSGAGLITAFNKALF